MRVTVVDPPAYTPPYDHSLCAALAACGLEVELATSRFRHGSVPAPEGYQRVECFYRWGSGSAAAKALQHPIDMLRLSRRVGRSPGSVTHFQWLPVPHFDRHLVKRFPPPRVLTAHDLLPREAGSGRRQKALELLEELDAIVVHSESGRKRMTDELGLPAQRVHVIPHGTFDYLAALGDGRPLDPAAGDLDGRQVVLLFGLIRPYKGVDLLVEAFADAPPEAVLLIVGKPRMPLEPLRRRAAVLGIADRVRFVPRFVDEQEIPGYFRRADLVVLPYRDTEQSGVLFTAIAFGVPAIVSDVGGLGEIAREHGVARLAPPGDVDGLRTALRELLADAGQRERLAQAARAAAAGPYSWKRTAELTERLYRSLLGNGDEA